MQFKPNLYDEKIHDRFRALTVKQPYANRIAEGQKTVELRTKNTAYRGDILICSSSLPELEGLESGASICLVELYDVKKVKDLTKEEKAKTCLHEKAEYWKHAKYGWMLRNPRRVIEYPVKGQLGIWNLVYTEGLIIPYPIYPHPKPPKNMWIKLNAFKLIWILYGIFGAGIFYWLYLIFKDVIK